MSPFTWFAIILTVGYIIYYTVMIMNDLYGKKPDEQHKAEEIDVPSALDGDAITDEAPVTVSESDEGFSVGEEQYEASLTPDEESIEEETVETTESSETASVSKAEDICNRTEPISEEIQPQFDDEYESEDFKTALINEGQGKPNRPEILAKPVIDEI